MANVIVSKQWISSQYDPEYERANFMGTVDSLRYGETDWIDPLDPRLLKLISGTIPYEEIAYTGQPITGLASKYYFNTTLWWLILMFNGYLHAHEIPDGAKIKIPSLEYIRSKLDRNTNEGRGKIVTM